MSGYFHHEVCLVDHEFCRSHHGTGSHRKTEIYITDCLGLYKKNHQVKKTTENIIRNMLFVFGVLWFSLRIVEMFASFSCLFLWRDSKISSSFFCFIICFLKFRQKNAWFHPFQKCVTMMDGQGCDRSSPHMKVCTADHQLADLFYPLRAFVGCHPWMSVWCGWCAAARDGVRCVFVELAFLCCLCVGVLLRGALACVFCVVCLVLCTCVRVCVCVGFASVRALVFCVRLWVVNSCCRLLMCN